MKNSVTLFFFLMSVFLFAQEKPYPNYVDLNEQAFEEWQNWTTPNHFKNHITEAPDVPVRHHAEWEELEAIVVTWRDPRSVLRNIIRHAKEEVKIIITYDSTHADSNYNSKLNIELYLLSDSISLDNIEIIEAKNNTIWSRDYLQSTVYANDVEDRYFVDWVYERKNRHKDDTMSYVLAEYLNTPIYSMSESPTRLASAGGNFMSDGLGTAFSSNLVLENNEPFNDFDAGPHDEVAIDSIHQLFLGINRYIKFPTLEHDIIHHVDMHMHLLDEETILWGQYPEGESDGPQIEANIQFLLDNFDSPFGTPYKIERIIQPPNNNGYYPPVSHLLNYTNFIFVNKKILVPTYNIPSDSIALDFFKGYFPGYEIVGINCNQIIYRVGALHCINKEIGVKDPLWIVHQKQQDIEDNSMLNGYEQTAFINHRSGIKEAHLYWTIDTASAYEKIEMDLINSSDNEWSATIPQQINETEIFYYIEGKANEGKVQVRPLPAPKAYYNFWVNDGPINSTEPIADFELKNIYPNPTNGTTIVPIYSNKNNIVEINLIDLMGQKIKSIFKGTINQGEYNLSFNADGFSAGIYFIQLKSSQHIFAQKIIIK